MDALRKPTVKVFVMLMFGLFPATGVVGEEAEGQQPAKGRGWSIGGGVLLKQEAYRGFDDKFFPIPLFNYQGKRFQVNGVNLRYAFLKGFGSSFGVVLEPRFDGYEPTDSAALVGMAERESTLDVGVDYETVFFKTFVFGGKITTDLLDEHGGFEASVKFGRRFSFNKRNFVFEPSLEYAYQSDDLVDHYYGVRPNEALPGRPAYEAAAATNLGLNLMFITRVSGRGSLLVLFKHEDLDGPITESPIVSENSQRLLIVGYTHRMGN